MIENGFVPTTVNEVLLLERIHQLRIEGYKNNTVSFDPTLSEKITHVRHITPTLMLAAELKAGWESDHRFKIDAIARLPDEQSLHIGHYVSAEQFATWTPRTAAHQLGKIHEVAIKNIAASIKDRL